MIPYHREHIPHDIFVDTIGAEIGVLNGEFAEVLIAKKPKHLTLIDAWATQPRTDNCTSAQQNVHDDRYEAVKKKFSQYDNVEVIKSYSHEAARLFEDHTFDWVYIDALHNYKSVTQDLTAWAPKIKPTGWIWGHDYRTKDFKPKADVQVREAVHDFCKHNDWQFVDYTSETPDLKKPKSYFITQDPNTAQRIKSL